MGTHALIHTFLPLHAQRIAAMADPQTAALCTLTWQRNGRPAGSVRVRVEPGKGVSLDYACNGQLIEPYLVRWVTTRPHFGGVRYWWRCPACNRRCATLYGGRYFLCRTCHRLAYASSQSRSRYVTVDARLYRIRRRLGETDNVGLFADLPERPRFMHRTTYARLCLQYEQLMWLRDLVFMAAAQRIPSVAAMGIPQAPLRQAERRARAEVKRLSTPSQAAAMVSAIEEPPPKRAPAQRPTRLTLHGLAAAAGVPPAFVRETIRAGLVRPDAGRTSRRKRFRPKLRTWVAKLYTLRGAGYTWEAIGAWSARRFEPGHEHERAWPAGFPKRPDSSRPQNGAAASEPLA